LLRWQEVLTWPKKSTQTQAISSRDLLSARSSVSTSLRSPAKELGHLSKKVEEGSKHARQKAREMRARAEDLVDSGKELVNEKKEQIAAKLEEGGEDYPPEKSKAKGV